MRLHRSSRGLFLRAASRQKRDAGEERLLEKNMKKLEELRQAVEECLAAIQDMSDSK